MFLGLPLAPGGESFQVLAVDQGVGLSVGRQIVVCPELLDGCSIGSLLPTRCLVARVEHPVGELGVLARVVGDTIGFVFLECGAK